MSDIKRIKKAFERARNIIQRKPEIGQKTVETRVRVEEGTTCRVEHKDWTFKVDIGEAEGGNNAGPGPGILERGALGSCLAIGYVQQAAVMGVPIEEVEVIVEADKDLRGRFGFDEQVPGSLEIRYRVLIESPANEDEIMKVVEEADQLSPVLDNFKRAVPLKREIQLASTQT